MSLFFESFKHGVTKFSLIVTCVVLVLILAGSVVGAWFAGIQALGAGIALSILWLFFVFSTSVITVEPDKMYTALFLYSQVAATFIPENFAEEKDDSGLRMDEEPYNGKKAQFILALWPLFDVVIEPTTAVLVDFNLLGYAEGGVPLNVDANLTLYFSPFRKRFYGKTNVLSRKFRDLAEETVVEVWQDGKVPDSQTKEKEGHAPVRVYRNPVIAAILWKEYGPVFMEAVRTMLEKHPFLGPNNVKGLVPNLEADVGRLLSVPESPLQRSGILKKIERSPDGSMPDTTPECGPSVVGFDINITRIDVVDPEFRKQLTKPAEGELEGRRLKRIEEESGMPAGETRAWESLDRTEDVSIFASENPLMALWSSLVNKDKASRHKKRDGSGGGTTT